MRKMHRALKILILVLCIAVLPIAVLPIAGAGAYADPPESRSIPFEQVFTIKSEEYPADFDFSVTYALTPVSGVNPGSEYRFTVSGRNVNTVLTFTTSGSGDMTYVVNPYPDRVCVYRLKPVRELAAAGVGFDESEYTITVRTGDGGIESIVCVDDTTGEKTDRVRFDPWYQYDKSIPQHVEPRTPKPQKNALTGYLDHIRQIVKTGDTQDLALSLLILLLAISTLSVLVLRSRRRKQGKTE